MTVRRASAGPERVQLNASLDAQRDAVLRKVEGLEREHLAIRLPPSSLTLGGLVNHLAVVEDWWFRFRFAGLPEDELWAGLDWDADPDYEFRTAAELEPDVLVARYRTAGERSRAVVQAASDLEQLSVRSGPQGQRWDLRWVILHMIEETARHAGHADLLREAVDGVVGT